MTKEVVTVDKLMLQWGWLPFHALNTRQVYDFWRCVSKSLYSSRYTFFSMPIA
ncbi:MAG: hypothetical protein H7240_06155 [Glaciimonas sp.]|nr:hypothetical protein [Glaciimonas sp.]